MRPVRLNLAMASLFAVGSTCFALGSVPTYATAVGATADSVTFFVGSLFFTAASSLQLVQAQTPAMTGADGRTQHLRSQLVLGAWLPHDRAWLSAAVQFPGTLFFNVSTFAALVHNATLQQQDRHVWRPDLFGSILFLAASVLALLAARSMKAGPSRTWTLAIGWINMAGSALFMASALASFVLPSTGGLIDLPVAVGGTFLGALCFLVGALLLLPAWRAAVAVAPRAFHPIETRSPT